MKPELSDSEVAVLRALQGHGSLPWHKLAQLLEVGVGYATFMELDDRTYRLRKLGYISRPGLGKASRYRLTGKGRRALRWED